MIKYVIGDATLPNGDGKKLIIHISNNLGLWGSGFVISLSKRYKQPEKFYRSVPKDKLVLGETQFVKINDELFVCNMIAQNGVISQHNPTPIRYDALETCLKKVNDFAVKYGYTIHAPMFGSGLAGGNWETIEQIINKTITVDITIYKINVSLT